MVRARNKPRHPPALPAMVYLLPTRTLLMKRVAADYLAADPGSQRQRDLGAALSALGSNSALCCVRVGTPPEGAVQVLYVAERST